MAQEAPWLDGDKASPPDAEEAVPEEMPVITDGLTPSETVDLQMPKVAYDDARRIMTRTDFLEPLDHLHVGHFRLSEASLLTT